MHDETHRDENAEFRLRMAALAPGTQLFQHLTLQKLLGRSDLGIVWLAEDDTRDRPVALKLIPRTLGGDGFGHEALEGLLAAHPNIARVFEFLEDQEMAAIAMEYVDGPTLSELLLEKRANCFAVSEIAPWVASLCDALAYAHDSLGLIHRNLKPANLMVTSRNELKITDFGIAAGLRTRVFALETIEGGGALHYVSPQQLQGEAPAPTDDIYAVGASLYELLSSRPPFFEGDVPSQVRATIPPSVAQRRRELGIVGEAVPRHWEETIAACLAKLPADRPQTPVDLARRLRLGGAIRLTAASDESRMRGLMQALFQSRVVGAAAGLAALLAAAVILLRSPHSAGVPGKPEITSTGQRDAPVTTGAFSVDPAVAPNSQRPSASPAPSPSGPSDTGAVQINASPEPASVTIYPGSLTVEEASTTPPVWECGAEGSIGNLAPGQYTLVFHCEGWPDERVEILLEKGQILPVTHTFVHGRASVTSVPGGAEIFLGSRSLGRAPLTVALPPGAQELVARYPSRRERKQTVTIEPEATVPVAFELRAAARTSRRKSRPPESAFAKFSRSVKNAFCRKPPPKRKKG